MLLDRANTPVAVVKFSLSNVRPNIFAFLFRKSAKDFYVILQNIGFFRGTVSYNGKGLYACIYLFEPFSYLSWCNMQLRFGQILQKHLVQEISFLCMRVLILANKLTTMSLGTLFILMADLLILHRIMQEYRGCLIRKRNKYFEIC